MVSMRLFKRYVSARGLTAFAFEILLIAGSLLVATRLHAPTDDADLIWRVALATGLFLVCLYFNDFYDLTVVDSAGEIVVRLFQAGGAASIILAAVYFIAPDLAVRERAFFPSLALFLSLTLIWRLFFNAVSQTRGLVERVLIIGTDTAAQAVARQIAWQHDFAYRLVGFVDDAPADDLPRYAPVLGGTKDIGYLVARHDVNRVVIAVSDRRGHLPVNELVRVKLSGVPVEEASTTYERLSGKILLENLKPSLFVFSDGFCVSPLQRFLKRAVDITLSFVGLVVGIVPMLLTALAVYLESGAPVLYRQERVGQQGRLFTLFKFRSMRIDAEGATPIWATEHDDRVTKVGRFIRITRLDELPQLWNVLRGEMSFVGPRPERKYFVEMLAEQIPFYHQRHAVKPGVTGWAQIKYRYGASVEDATEKLRYDLYYIKHLSVIFDLTIVFDTLKVIVSGKGAQ
jgi:sugar transferase (PEP-CTERM system associated)